MYTGLSYGDDDRYDYAMEEEKAPRVEISELLSHVLTIRVQKVQALKNEHLRILILLLNDLKSRNLSNLIGNINR